MANWKGIDFAGDLARVVRHMPEVETYRESLQTLQAVWDNLTVLGQMSGTGTEITGMRAAFAQLTGTLLNRCTEGQNRRISPLPHRTFQGNAGFYPALRRKAADNRDILEKGKRKVPCKGRQGH
ncbi:MAG TPA: hypothetical protein PLM62_06555 [Zoogloea sp.]|nr:hypothetical protein [Zoogloea sp.]